MRGIVLTIFSLFFATSVFAQIDFGVRAGLISNNFNISDFDKELEDIKSDDKEFGFQLGLAVRLKISKVHIEFDPTFSNYEAKYTVRKKPTFGEVKDLIIDQSQSVFELPVMVGARFAGFLDVFAGPKFALELSNDIKLGDLKDKIKQDYKEATVGYQIGTGIKIKKFMVDIRYNSSFGSITDGIKIGEDFYKAHVKPNSLIGSVTLFL